MNLRKAFWIFAALTILTMIADRILFVIFPNYLIVRGFTATEIGLVFSAAALLLLLSRTFLGRLSDIIGRKRLLCAGLLLDGAAVALFPFAARLGEFALIKSLREVAGTLTTTLETALIGDTFPRRVRARTLANLGVIFPFSRALAVLIGFLVVSYLSVVAGFWVAAAALLLAFMLFAVLFKESRPQAQVNRHFALSFRSFSLPLKLVSVISLLEAISFNAAYFPAVFVLARSIGITEGLLFLMLLVDYLVSGAFVYWTRSWLQRFGHERILALGLAAWTAFTVAYAFVSTVLQFLFVIIGISLAFYIWRISFQVVLLEHTQRSLRGQQIGFVKTLEGMGDMLGPALGGFIIDAASLTAAFWAAGVAGAIAALLALWLSRWHLKAAPRM